MRRSLVRSVALAAFASPLAVIVACTNASEDGGPAPTTREAPPQTVTTNPAPAVGPQGPSTPAACEELGDLSGTSLVAKASGTAAATSMAVANRPVLTRLAVSAYGPASALVGQSVALGAGDDANLATCTHCLALAVGCTAATCADAAWFFPRGGSATFTKVGYAAGDTFEGTFQDVVLEQVKIDFATMTSTPVPGRACVRIASLAFSATVATGEAPHPDAGATDAGGSRGGVVVDQDAGSRSGGGGGGGVKGQLF